MTARVDKDLKHSQQNLYKEETLERWKFGKVSFAQGLLFSGKSGKRILLL